MKIKKKISILITCLGGRRAIDIINVLKKNKIYDYEIFGTDIKKNFDSMKCHPGIIPFAGFINSPECVNKT